MIVSISSYRQLFSIFYAIIELRGFLNSWDTQALINYKNLFSTFD